MCVPQEPFAEVSPNIVKDPEKLGLLYLNGENGYYIAGFHNQTNKGIVATANELASLIAKCPNSDLEVCYELLKVIPIPQEKNKDAYEAWQKQKSA